MEMKEICVTNLVKIDTSNRYVDDIDTIMGAIPHGYRWTGKDSNTTSSGSCNCGEKGGEATPPVGTRVSFFERSLLEPNSARLTPGPEGDNITQLIPTQRSPRASPGADRVNTCKPLITGWLLPLQTFNHGLVATFANL